MGGGGPGKIGQEKDKAVYDMVMELLTGTRPIAKEVAAQGAEGFETGDIKALYDTISQAMEGSMTQSSEDREAAKTLLAQRGLARTPFGAKTLANLNLQGRQRTGLVKSDIINAFLQRLAPALTGQSVETAISGESSLADAATRRGLAERQGQGDMLSALIGGVGQLGAAGIQGYANSTAATTNANAANSVPIGPSPAGGNIAPVGY